MEIPTVDKLLHRIERRAMKPEWFDPDVMVQMFRRDNQLWYRHPDSDTILKITVEELPRDQWPDMLAGYRP